MFPHSDDLLGANEELINTAWMKCFREGLFRVAAAFEGAIML